METKLETRQLEFEINIATELKRFWSWETLSSASAHQLLCVGSFLKTPGAHMSSTHSTESRAESCPLLCLSSPRLQRWTCCVSVFSSASWLQRPMVSTAANDLWYAWFCLTLLYKNWVPLFSYFSLVFCFLTFGSLELWFILSLSVFSVRQ